MKIARSRALALAALALAALAAPSAAQAPSAYAAARVGAPAYGPSYGRAHGPRPVRSYGYGGHRAYGPVPAVPAVIGAARRVWVPGHMVTEVRSVWVPDRIERRWVEPVYELRLDDCGNAVRVLIRAGHWSEVCVPGHYEPRTVQVWKPGSWQIVYGR